MDPQSVLDPISIRCRSESVPIDLGSIRGQSGIGQGSAWGRPAVGGQAGRDRRSTRRLPGANPMSAPVPTQCQPGVDQESIRERLRVDLMSTPGLLSIEVDPGSIQRRSVVGGRSGVDQGPIRDRPGDRVVRTDPECIRVDPGRPRIGAGSTRGLPAVAARSTGVDPARPTGIDSQSAVCPGSILTISGLARGPSGVAAGKRSWIGGVSARVDPGIDAGPIRIHMGSTKIGSGSTRGRSARR